VALPHQRDVKLVLDLQAAYLQAHGAVAVLATCSSIGPAVVIVSQLVDVPVLRIDEPMASAAIETGRRIGVLATVASTLNPTVDLLRRRAQDLRKERRDHARAERPGIHGNEVGRWCKARRDRS
jgi:Asp/Glu/hydantoin racemase